MQAKRQTVDINLSITEKPYQHPEESLRVISNYSSLERMYHKSKQSKIYPQLALPKRDSFNIVGWQHTPNKEKQMKASCNRAKFKTSSLNNTLRLTQTIVTQKGIDNKSTARRRLSPANQVILKTTNFKTRRISQKNIQFRYRTLSFDSQNKFQQQAQRQKKEILKFYQNQAMKRKEIRQNYRPNPQSCIPLTQYPVMSTLSNRKGCRRLRKQQFLRKHYH